MKHTKSLFSAKNTGKLSRQKNKNAVIRVMQSSVRLLHTPVHRARNDPTLLRGAQPEESSSFSNTEQLLQIGILHFKHVYFVVLKHELYMSSSLLVEHATQSFARRPSAMFFFLQHPSTHALRENRWKKYIIIIYAFDWAHVKYGV